MEVSLKQMFIAAGVVLVLFLGLAAFWTIDKRSHEAQIVQLQNEVASRDKTIELKDGVYQKLAIQSQDLEQLLSSKDQQLKDLKDQLDKTGSQLLTANTLVVQLKQKLTATGTPTVVVRPTDPTQAVADSSVPGRTDLKASSDLGPFHVDCDIDVPGKIDPKNTSYGIQLSQVRPFRFSVAVSQDKDGTWKSSSTSSEKDFQVDIALSAVNPFLLEPKWYEKIGMGVDLGIGTNPGLLAGIGLYYEIGKFEVGPRAWVVVDKGVSPYFGAQMIWHPFQR